MKVHHSRSRCLEKARVKKSLAGGTKVNSFRYRFQAYLPNLFSKARSEVCLPKREDF